MPTLLAVESISQIEHNFLRWADNFFRDHDSRVQLIIFRGGTNDEWDNTFKADAGRHSLWHGGGRSGGGLGSSAVRWIYECRSGPGRSHHGGEHDLSLRSGVGKQY